MGRMRRRPRAAHAAPPVAACCLAPQLIACGQAQPGPLPPPDPDQIIDRYLSGTETAFADGSLVELQQSVSEIAYQVDGEIITRLAAGGRHEERSFHRVGHARVITSGSGGTYLVIETSIRVDRDADVDSHGRNTVRFAPQTLLLQYTFLRLTADVARLLQACLATPQSEPIVGASPVIPTPASTPLDESSPGSAPAGTPPGPEVVPSPTAQVIGPGDLQTPPPMSGPCNMEVFPF